MTELPDTPGPLDPPEQDLARRLAAGRPVPAADFRGALGRRLLAADPGYGPRPVHLRAMVSLYLCGGGALAALGVLTASGGL